MHLAAYCPHCSKTVAFEDRICGHCGSSLTKAKFPLSKIAIVGALGLLVALVISTIAVPLAVILIIASFFMRDRLHVTRFDDDPTPTPGSTPVTVNVVETKSSASS